tara:strand:- start:289 stop:498 length:210 start_codon:yes stop_codon:yes gene_type:complete
LSFHDFKYLNGCYFSGLQTLVQSDIASHLALLFARAGKTSQLLRKYFSKESKGLTAKGIEVRKEEMHNS